MPEVGGTQASTGAGPITRGSVVRVGTATALTGLCGYVVIYLAARDLDPGGFSVFGVFWGAFGLVTGASLGLLQETTREIRSTRHISAAVPVGDEPRTHPLRVAMLVGVGAAAVIAGSSPLWSGRVFVEQRWLSVALLSVGLAGFCVHATLLGMLAGTDRWTGYGALMVTDAVIRVTVAAATVVLGWRLVGFLWATVAGAVAWLILLVASPSARAAAPPADAPARADLPARGRPFDHRRRRERDSGDGISGVVEADQQRTGGRRRGDHPRRDVDAGAAAGAADGHAGQPDRAFRRRAHREGSGPGAARPW